MSTEKPKQQASQAGASPAKSSSASPAAKKPVGKKKRTGKRTAAKPDTKKATRRKPSVETHVAGPTSQNTVIPETPKTKLRDAPQPAAQSRSATSASAEAGHRDGMNWLTIAGVVVALVLAGYAAYQTTLSRQFSDVNVKAQDERVSLLVTDQQGLKREFSDLAQQRSSADSQRDARLSELQLQLSTLQVELEKVQLASQASTDDIKASLGRAVARWKLDEMQSILVRVNQYYQLGGDKSRAIRGLDLVRSMLAGIDDPRLSAVSDAVAKDLLRIQSDALPDIAEINSRLMALSALVPKLTLAGEAPESKPADAESKADDSAEAGMLAAGRSFLEDIGSMVKYTNRDAPLRPSLDSNERFIMYELLQLKLQIAMAALMRGDNGVYQAQLKSASDKVGVYFEPDESVTQSMQSELASLLAEQVALEIEPLSAALSALNRVMILEK